MCGEHKIVALGLLFANRQQCYSRVGDTGKDLDEHRTHDPELQKMNGLAIRIRTDVNQNGEPSVAERNEATDGGTPHAFD